MSKVYPSTYDQFSRPEPAGIEDFGPSRTKQEFAEEADINLIMERYTETGEIPVAITGTYGDFSEAPDFMQAQEILLRANAQFAALPAKVRSRFNNDPAEFLEFVHEPGHEAELRALGLLQNEPEKPAAPAQPPVNTEEKPAA